MESLRDEDIYKGKSVTEASSDKTIIESGAETESRLEDPAVDPETPEAWPYHQDKNNRETSSERLRWLLIIGENMGYFKL